MLNWKKERDFKVNKEENEISKVLGIDQEEYTDKLSALTTLFTKGKMDPVEISEYIGQHFKLGELVLCAMSLITLVGQKRSISKPSVFGIDMSKEGPDKLKKMLDRLENAESEEEIRQIFKDNGATETDLKDMFSKRSEDSQDFEIDGNTN